jgi:hypothetical protein
MSIPCIHVCDYSSIASTADMAVIPAPPILSSPTCSQEGGARPTAFTFVHAIGVLG